MFLTLLEKLNYEYEKYVMYLNLSSRPEFMTRAYEIASKKAIYERMIKAIEDGEINVALEKKLLAIDNLIDVMYMKGDMKNNITLRNGKLTDTSWSQLLIGVNF
jgi:hypothetical protein